MFRLAWLALLCRATALAPPRGAATRGAPRGVARAAPSMSAAPPLKAAILGGGLGGLTCAIALRKVGVDATVYERARALTPQAGTGLTLWPNGLSALGAIDAEIPGLAAARGCASEEIEVTSVDGSTSLPNPTGDPKRFPATYGHPMLNIQWGSLQELLASRLPDGCVRLGHEFKELELLDGGARAHFATADGGSAVAEADFVVGADGINSALRGQLVGDGAPRDAGRTIWRSILPPDVDAAALLPPRHCSMSAGEGKVGFVTDIGAKEGGASQIYWSAFATDAALEKSTVNRDDYDDVREYLLAEFKDVHRVEACIAAAAPGDILERRVADRAPLVDADTGAARIPWAGTATLLGDAFHAMIPSLGQGANSSFEGAHRLASAIQRLLSGGEDGDATRDVEAALRAYEVDQMERAHWIVEQSSSQGRAVYKDTDEFVRNQQKAQDQMWGIKFEPL